MQTEQTTLVIPSFDQIQDTVGEGIYKVRIIDAKLDKWAGRDGKPDTRIIVWTVETFGELVDKNNGRRIFHRTPIEGPGAFRLQSWYRAFMHEDCPTTGFDMTMLLGREAEVTYGPQKNNPEYMEVKSVKALTQA